MDKDDPQLFMDLKEIRDDIIAIADILKFVFVDNYVSNNKYTDEKIEKLQCIINKNKLPKEIWFSTLCYLPEEGQTVRFRCHDGTFIGFRRECDSEFMNGNYWWYGNCIRKDVLEWQPILHDDFEVILPGNTGCDHSWDRIRGDDESYINRSCNKCHARHRKKIT